MDWYWILVLCVACVLSGLVIGGWFRGGKKEDIRISEAIQAKQDAMRYYQKDFGDGEARRCDPFPERKR